VANNAPSNEANPSARKTPTVTTLVADVVGSDSNGPVVKPVCDRPMSCTVGSVGAEFDLLINAEVIVDDVSIAERVFVERLGFPEPKSTWSRKEPGFGFTFLFARVHPSMAVSPTRIEAMAVAPLDQAFDPEFTLPFLPKLLAAQGDRPWKTHGNEVAASDIDAVAARLEANGCRFHTMPRTEQTPNARLWLGWTSEDPGDYRPDDDGGLFMEVCETAALMQGPRLFVPEECSAGPAGSMVRVVQRSWIVEDLEQSLAALERNFDWRPCLGPEFDTVTGCRRAVLSFVHPRSAVVELLQPVASGEVADSLEAWGPGSWAIRIGVNDLEAKADDLRRRATGFDYRTGSEGDPIVRVDSASLGVPGLFEFMAVE
jgi:hypothetical protein